MASIAQALAAIPAPKQFYAASDEDVRALLDQLSAALYDLRSEDSQAAALRIGAEHAVWQVRSCILRCAAEWYPLRGAEEIILKLTHDSVDVVAFQAIRLCGRLCLQAAIPHLTRISGWPSRFTQPGYLRKPVGVGAALTKRALIEIFGSDDPNELTRLEEEFLATYRDYVRAFRPPADITGMVCIPPGPFTLGSHERDDFRFEYRDYIPFQMVDLPEFYIDHLPVTNREYRVVAEMIEGSGHLTCHPDEPPNKSHWPAHLRDPRFNRDAMPVTGIDWYDAYAYAAWKGKKLPTEVQWEKAARGIDGRDYPWGNEWRPDLVNYIESSFGEKVDNLNSWEDLLRRVSDEYPPAPIWEVDRCPNAQSPYGVRDMVGNVWEWTRTNFYTREDMDPFFRERGVLEFTNRQEAFPVIRGGCWTSLPEMLRTSFRGKDLLTDRHYEIGFRCVVEESITS